MTDAILIATAFIVTLTYSSLFEWVVHRYLYHPLQRVAAMSRPHHAHHDVLYPAKAYYEWKGKYRSYRAVQPYWLETAYVILHGVPLFLLSRASIPAARGMALTALAVLVFYAAATHYVHPLIHLRTGRFYERTKLFKYLLVRHIWHHRHTDMNFNTVLPVGDWLFGTTHQKMLRARGEAEVPAEEIPTVEPTAAE